METAIEVNLADLVMDYSIYPRTKIESFNVSKISEALKAGFTVPPIIIEKKSKRVIDGFHRTTAYRALKRLTIEAIEREYPSEQELFLDAIHLNASHGRQFSTYDNVRCINRSLELGIDISKVAMSLNITTDRASTLSIDHSATTDSGKTQVSLKNTIRFKKGQELTEGQVEAIPRIGGQHALYYVNQLILLLQSDLIDLDNVKLMARFAILKELVETMEENFPVNPEPRKKYSRRNLKEKDLELSGIDGN